jgi:hypothetical protein
MEQVIFDPLLRKVALLRLCIPPGLSVPGGIIVLPKEVSFQPEEHFFIRSRV